MLEAVSALSCLQVNPTILTIAKLDRLLGHASTHSDATSIIYASDMILSIYSDTSFNSRPQSKSVAGGYHYLSRTDDPHFLNAAIVNVCSTIPVVCGAVSEAELAALYGNLQVAVEERAILASLGCPQPPTRVLCDNECAVGLSSDTVRKKKSKSIDHRFDWVRDRVRQLQFVVSYCPGPDNLADFFTKSLPVHVFTLLAPFFATPARTPPL